jgi:hypothetical protein
VAGSQPRQIVCETLSGKYLTQKRADGSAQVVEHQILSSNLGTTKTKTQLEELSNFYGCRLGADESNLHLVEINIEGKSESTGKLHATSVPIILIFLKIYFFIQQVLTCSFHVCIICVVLWEIPVK